MTTPNVLPVLSEPSTGAALSPPTPAFAPPIQSNYSDHPKLLLTGNDQWGEYFSTGMKITYTKSADGVWRAETGDAEPMIDEQDDVADDAKCTRKGNGWNQRTTWFPDTGIFIRGGKLVAVTAPSGESMPLLPMSRADRDYVMVPVGAADARTPEMAYVPCVGEFRVSGGHRSISYVALGATLVLKDEKSKAVRVTLPTRPLPHLLMRYQSGAMIPVPMRLTVATVDLRRGRMVLQFQATAPVAPPVRVIEWRAIPAVDQPAEGESLARYRERTAAIADDLASCPTPRRPFEPCASPLRWPNRKIFSAN